MTYLVSPACVACDVEQGVAILDVQNNTYYSLDPVGASVWRLIEGKPASLDDLAQGIAAEYDVAPDACRADISDLLEDMMKHGLVQAA